MDREEEFRIQNSEENPHPDPLPEYRERGKRLNG
jgi:hypothetical protein